MGAACCIKPPSKPQNFDQLPDFEEIHVAEELHITYPDSELLIPTKRTSEPSLLPLKTQITNMIHTFEKHHGTIGNSFTRTNTLLNSLSEAPKIRQCGQQISEIIKPNSLNAILHIRNNSGEKEKGQYLPLIKQNRQSNYQKLQSLQKEFQYYNRTNRSSNKENWFPQQKQRQIKQSVNNIPKIKLKQYTDGNINLDDSESCSWDEDNFQDTENQDQRSEQQSNLLDNSLINEEVNKQKQQLVKKYSSIQGTDLQPWEPMNLQSFVMCVKDITSSNINSIHAAALSAIAIYYQIFKITLCAYEETNNSLQVKICVNGHKRLIALKKYLTTPVQIFSSAIDTLYSNSQISTNPCNEVYHLSGWVPEVLYLQDIHNKQNLWERLVQNFNDGNILITFGCSNEDGEYLTLHSINALTYKLKLVSTKIVQDQSHICDISWEKLLEIVSTIYINWNPSIYNFVKKVDNKWITKTTPFENQAVCVQNNPQYLIKIPKHSQDFQIRVFADRYISSFDEGKRLCLKLYEYQGSRIMNPHQAIRTLQTDSRQLISDVFIFQKSETVDYFVLVVMNDDDQIKDGQEVGFSLLFLSFVDVQIKELPRRQILLTDNVISNATKNNLGYGLNSPDFLNNLQYSLRVPPEACLQIQVQSTYGCEFNLILIQNKNYYSDLAKIDFETVLNQSVISQVFQKYGYLEKQTAYECYILVIAMIKYQPNCKFKITTNIVSKMFKRNKELQACYPSVSIDQTIFNPKIIKQIDIKWSMSNSGPRKRLKHTSTQVVYHPVSVFQQFLKNPYQVLKLEKGIYQFNLICNSYRTQFFKNDHVEGEPPALSIAILKNSDNNKGYKIIVDDAFYVPIGYGFWTSELSLEEGKYTIVCARVDKTEAKGKLSIRKL